MILRQFLLLFSLLFFLACSTSQENEVASNEERDQQPKKIKVLSTISMIDDLVRQVGGDYIYHGVLIKGDLDPHSYQLVKGDDEKFASADLIFYNGLGLEHGPSLQHLLMSNPKAIPLGNLVLAAEPFLMLQVNGQIDPHIWMDVSIWSKIIPYITDALIKKDPEHLEYYQENGKKLLSQMEEAHKEIKNELNEIPQEKRYLVTSHDAFQYFTRAYLATNEEKDNGKWQNRFAAPEGLAPESQLSAHDIQKIIDHLKTFQILVLFPESNVSKDSIRKILQAGKENGLNIKIADNYLYADAMGSPGSDGDTYLKMLLHNAHVIKQYLDKN